MSVDATAELVGCSDWSVRRVRDSLIENPQAALEGLPVLEVVSMEGRKWHRCSWCGEKRRGRKAGVRHFLEHVLPREVIPRNG